MAEMIEAEPDLLEAIATGADTSPLALLIRSAPPLTVVGCGTSEHASLAVAEMLTEAGTPATSREAFEAVARSQPRRCGDRHLPRGRHGGHHPRDGGGASGGGGDGADHGEDRFPGHQGGRRGAGDAVRRSQLVPHGRLHLADRSRPGTRRSSGRRPRARAGERGTALPRRGRRAGPAAVGLRAADHRRLGRRSHLGARADAQDRGGLPPAVRDARPRDVPARPPAGLRRDDRAWSCSRSTGGGWPIAGRGSISCFAPRAASAPAAP